MPGERGWYSYGAKEDGTAGVFIRGARNRIAHSTFRDFWGQGVHCREGEGNVVEHCTFENFNWLALQDGAAVFLNGRDHTVRHCTIRNGAAMGISGKQVGPHLVQRAKVLHNDIADTGRLLLDSGQSAIYFNNHNAPTDERRLDGVIAWNRIGTVHGLRDNGKGMGIYLDDGTDYVDIHDNFIDAGPKIRWPIFLHAGGHAFENTRVTGNLVCGIPDDPRAAAVVMGPKPKVGRLSGIHISGNVSSRGIAKMLHGPEVGVTQQNNESHTTPDVFAARLRTYFERLNAQHQK